MNIYDISMTVKEAKETYFNEWVTADVIKTLEQLGYTLKYRDVGPIRYRAYNPYRELIVYVQDLLVSSKIQIFQSSKTTASPDPRFHLTIGNDDIQRKTTHSTIAELAESVTLFLQSHPEFDETKYGDLGKVRVVETIPSSMNPKIATLGLDREHGRFYLTLTIKELSLVIEPHELDTRFGPVSILGIELYFMIWKSIIDCENSDNTISFTGDELRALQYVISDFINPEKRSDYLNLPGVPQSLFVSE